FVGKTPHQLDARGKRLRRPLRPGAPGANHRLVDVAHLAAPQGGPCRRLVGNDLAGAHGTVGDLEVVSGDTERLSRKGLTAPVPLGFQSPLRPCPEGSGGFRMAWP